MNSEKRREYLLLAALLTLAALLRYLFVSSGGLCEFDPWRHLLLIENIRNASAFTLFGGQPYIWYNKIWYWLAALLVAPAQVQWLSAILSLCTTALFFHFLLRMEKSLPAAAAGTLLLAGYGPFIAFTATYGSESFSFLLMVLVCLLATYPSRPSLSFGAGILFGIVLLSRITFVFNGLLPLMLLKERRARLSFVAAAGAVLMLGWWQNHTAITTDPFVFTWDGLATRSADYNIFSTLVPQLHPAVAAATRSLYQHVAPLPFDLFSRGMWGWGNLFFVVAGTICVLATGRPALTIATLSGLLYFNLLDKTLSTNFYRNYLALFLPLCIGMGVICGGGRGDGGKVGWKSARLWLVVIAMLVSGIGYLRPGQAPALELVTPEPAFVTKQSYLVNSGFYHPESLLFRYPGKRFVGMPLDPAQFEAFSRWYPGYQAILWHRQFSVQEPLFDYLTGRGGFKVVASTTTPAGLEYLILEKDDQGGLR